MCPVITEDIQYLPTCCFVVTSVSGVFTCQSTAWSQAFQCSPGTRSDKQIPHLWCWWPFCLNPRYSRNGTASATQNRLGFWGADDAGERKGEEKDVPKITEFSLHKKLASVQSTRRAVLLDCLHSPLRERKGNYSCLFRKTKYLFSFFVAH